MIMYFFFSKKKNKFMNLCILYFSIQNVTNEISISIHEKYI